MRIRWLALTLVLPALGNAQVGTPTRMSLDTTRWLLVGFGSGIDLYADRQRHDTSSDGRLSVWMLTEWDSVQHFDTVTANGLHRIWFASIISHEEISCSSMQNRLLASYAYNLGVVETIVWQSTASSAWTDIIPNSVGETAYKTLCAIWGPVTRRQRDLGAVGQVPGTPSTPSPPRDRSPRVGSALLLYGGEDNKVFLGCLTCNQYAANSVLNEYGEFGSRYSSTSIRNGFGDYGSKYSDYSACNQYAGHSPVVIDRLGNFYGHLTVNPYGGQVQNQQLISWLRGICGT